MQISPLFYKLGKRICEKVPRRCTYPAADLLALGYSLFTKKDKENVGKNLEVIFGTALPLRQKEDLTRQVFMNFARYLVDFFSVEALDDTFIRRYVQIEGTAHLEQVRAKKKGIVILSAHLGNWELGGIVAGMIGYHMHAVALSHTHREINTFFNSQRMRGNMTVIPLGTAVRKCFKLLKESQIVALVGDREFGNNGVSCTMFGRKVILPPGPAFFALKTDAAIVPSFMVRESHYGYRLVFEEPVYSIEATGQLKPMDRIMTEYISVMERYIKQYATQWFMFTDYFSEAHGAIT